MSQRTGGCTCGQLRYEMRTEPLIVHCCHCSNCQRETGSAFATNMLVEADRVTISGDFETVSMPSGSGQGQKIIRCSNCHVAISSQYLGAGDEFHFLRVGTLDERSDIAPDVHIFVATKQSWVAIPDGVRAFSEYYDPAEVWTDAMRERWAKAKGR